MKIAVKTRAVKKQQKWRRIIKYVANFFFDARKMTVFSIDFGIEWKIEMVLLRFSEQLET